MEVVIWVAWLDVLDEAPNPRKSEDAICRVAVFGMCVSRNLWETLARAGTDDNEASAALCKALLRRWFKPVRKEREEVE